jgi:hypothetical protein
VSCLLLFALLRVCFLLYLMLPLYAYEGGHQCIILCWRSNKPWLAARHLLWRQQVAELLLCIVAVPLFR